ncbi:MAG: xanthine dehydrogenase family protein molybdopterin-binding subunit [Pseudomonadota bacterium]
METFGKSQSVTRKEDLRFLTGAGRYIDDIAPDTAFHAYFLRSSFAHGEITELDVSDAREAEGVQAVFTAEDLEAQGLKLNIGATVLENRDGSKAANPSRPAIAKGRVRFVGEPVAVIVANTLDQARDAAELILFDVDELPAKTDLALGGPEIHPEAPQNRVFDWDMGDAEVFQAAYDSAVHKLDVVVEDNRVIAASMEPRGCYAELEGDRLHFAYNGQGVWGEKDNIAKALGMKPEDIRVTNPDVGGGFGMKAMTYPEYRVIAHLARHLANPVRWMSDRSEAMLTDNAGRDLVSTIKMGFDESYKLVAYSVDTLANMGAYNSAYAQPIQTQLFSKVLTGVYDVQAAYLAVQGVYTNTTQVDAYRGAGRPEAIYVLERAMDYAARKFGIDPWDLRRRSFIKADAFPYLTAVGETYDVGDFDKVLNRVEAEADRAGFAARKAAAAQEGKLLGQGLCYYIESILGNPSETAKVVFPESGGAEIYVGTQSNGQGHETVYAQFLSDHTGIPADVITVIQGDSDLIKTGGGTGGSRSVTTQNTATLATTATMIAKFSDYLSEKEGGEVSFDDERFRIEGSNLTPTMLDVADMARADGRADLLSFEERTTLPARSFPNGAHVAEVEVDPATGVTRVVKYTVVDDFGNLINPMLAEGQVHGGVVQGVGQAVTERVVYDDNGQLLTASFMDYGLPRADDMPFIAFYSEPVPSTANVMGMKGCGEAGTVGALAAVANAFLDAVWETGVRKVDMPFTPERVWSLIEAQKIAAE